MDKLVLPIVIIAIILALFMTVFFRKTSKKCPKCKMEIPKGATVCPYCRSRINTTLGLAFDSFDGFFNKFLIIVCVIVFIVGVIYAVIASLSA